MPPNAMHVSTTDAKLSFLVHALMENRSGLVVVTALTEASLLRSSRHDPHQGQPARRNPFVMNPNFPDKVLELSCLDCPRSWSNTPFGRTQTSWSD
jgi:hypothetical protein